MNTKQNITIGFFILFFVFSAQVNAQKGTGEFGLTIGTSYYRGDINHSRIFYSPKLAYGILYRHNLNDRNSFRVQLASQPLTGSDLDFSSGYQQTRGHSFRNNIIELGAQYELHFSPYNPRKRLKYTSYLTLGAAAIITSSPIRRFTASIPFGIGFKYGFSKRLTFGAEWTYKKTFTDQLDLIPVNTYSPVIPPSSIKQRSYDSSPDWYSLAGIIISFNFASAKKWCPAYDRRK